MRKWIDSLLARWYVPRWRYDIAAGLGGRYLRQFGPAVPELVAECGTVVVTTDYNRGIPCS